MNLREKKAAAYLEDIEVHEVSMVDKAANKRTFLVCKSAEGASPADGDKSAGDSGQPPAGDQPPAEGVEKAGRKMAKERLGRLKDAVSAIQTILGELEPAIEEIGDAADAIAKRQADAAAAGPSEAEKAAVAKAAELEKQVAELTAKQAAQETELKATKEKVAKQAKVINEARLTVVGSNSEEPERETTRKSAPVVWPRDLSGGGRRSKAG